MKNFLSVFLVVMVLLTFAFFAIASSDDSTIDTGESNTNVSSNNITTSVSENVNLIYEDDIIGVEFIKISNNVIDGMFDLYIKADNNSGKDITVMLKDVCINGSMVEVGSGVPCDIISEANRTHVFFGRLDLAGITSAEEVTELSFKVWVVDEDFNTILTTEDLKVIV